MKNLFLKELYELTKDVEYDIIMSVPEETEEEIRKFINLDDCNTETELRILRNYLVMTISNSNKDNYDNYDKNRILIAILTGMIDNKLFKIGAEV